MPTFESLTRDEVIRRLRKLKEPATLFGESDEARFARMLAAEAAAVQQAVEEEAVGGQQENLHIRLAREAREAKARQLAAAEAKKKAAAVAASGKGKEGAGGGGEGTADGGDAEPADPEQAGLMAAFQQAAEAVAEARMPPEDRIAKWLRRWMADWEQDLEARPEEVKATPAGLQADMRYKETVQYMKPLFAQVRPLNGWQGTRGREAGGSCWAVEQCSRPSLVASLRLPSPASSFSSNTATWILSCWPG